MRQTLWSSRSFLIKIVAFWGLFLFFHFLYEWIPITFIVVFSGNSEGVVQHMKIAFWAYAFTSLGEFFICRPSGDRKLTFLDSRLLLNILAPWMMFFWYIGPVILDKPLASDIAEVIYANVILLLIAVSLFVIERDISSILLSRTSRIILMVFWILTVFLFTVVSFKIPWAGFFVQ